MPCYDSRNEPDNVRAEALREFTHNSPVAEMLCDLMRQADDGYVIDFSPELLAWWEEHKARDAAREKDAREE